MSDTNGADIGQTDSTIVNRWFGLYVHGDPAKDLSKFWTFPCPCGVVVHYAINELPTVTTKHPCAHPEHWTICISDQPVHEAPPIPYIT